MEDRKTMLSQDFPTRLKELRKSRGWSQGQLAKKIGADLQRISKYERGVQWPTMELMLRIATVFEVSVDYLIRDDQGLSVSKIKNTAFLKHIEEVDHLPEDDQKTILSFLDAFIKRRKFEELVQST